MDSIQRAVINLLQGEGLFYASLLMQMRRVDDPNLPEHALAGVSVQNGRILLHVDAPRLEKFSTEQVQRILTHELLHLCYEHLSRLDSKHPYTWNIASDLSINCLIPKMDLGLIPGKEPFTNFPVGKTAEFYYTALHDKIKNYTASYNADGSVTITYDKTGKSVTYQPTGDHSGWKKSGGKGEADSITREVIKQAVAEAARQVKKAQGQFPAGIEELIKELLGKEVVNWRKLLKQYVGNAVKADRHYTWKRESKRYGADQKGRCHTRTLDIAVAIDTSGSISTEDFGEFMTEIYGLMKSYKAAITILECDAAVQKVYKLQKHGKVDTKFKGRGGTSFVPSFKYFEEKRSKPSLLIYFTDGYGDFPPKETMRTVWVITSSGSGDIKVPFGRVIKLDKHK